MSRWHPVSCVTHALLNGSLELLVGAAALPAVQARRVSGIREALRRISQVLAQSQLAVDLQAREALRRWPQPFVGCPPVTREARQRGIVSLLVRACVSGAWQGFLGVQEAPMPLQLLTRRSPAFRPLGIFGCPLGDVERRLLVLDLGLDTLRSPSQSRSPTLLAIGKRCRAMLLDALKLCPLRGYHASGRRRLHDAVARVFVLAVQHPIRLLVGTRSCPLLANEGMLSAPFNVWSRLGELAFRPARRSHDLVVLDGVASAAQHRAPQRVLAMILISERALGDAQGLVAV